MVLISIQFALLLIGIIIGGMATLISLIFVILSLVGGKNTSAIYWSIGFVLSISIVLISVVQLVDRVSHKVKSGIEWAKEHENDLITSDNTNFDYNSIEREHLIDTLKNMVDEKYSNKIPDTFYLNSKEQIIAGNTDTLPFIYPYAFEYKDYNFNLVNILQSGVIQPFIEQVSQIAYDGNFILLKIDKTNAELKNNEPEISYLLFDLKTGKQKQFLNFKKLLDEASAMGYKGNTGMIYVSDMYQAWIVQEYD